MHIYEAAIITKEVGTMIDHILRMMREMKLSAMADEFETLSQDKYISKMNPLDVVEQIISAEYSSEKNITVQRRLKQAYLSDHTARLEDIDYDPSRQINHNLIDQLATNDYIAAHRNVLIFGATGCGKTYIGNCLGINACEARYRVRYTRLTELLNEFSIARIEGNLQKIYKVYAKYDLLIIDDFLLVDTSATEQKDLIELFEYRDRNRSTILCSQLSVEEWHGKLGGGYIADSILDRVTNNSYRIILQGESQRKLRNSR